MRLCIALVLVGLATPVCAQTAVGVAGSSSSSTALVNISDPPASASDPASRVVTTPTIVAPGLAAAGVETCLGSASGGISLMGAGLTLGATKVDEGCTIRLLARQLFAFGLRKAAVALMCQDGRVAAAMAVAGSLCPSPEVEIGKPLALAPEDNASAVPDITGVATQTTALRDADAPDLPPAAEQPQSHFSLLAPPFSPQERAWFDRASAMN